MEMLPGIKNVTMKGGDAWYHNTYERRDSNEGNTTFSARPRKH